MKQLLQDAAGGYALRPFQVEAVEALRERRSHLAVDAAPGLGKSLIALAAVVQALDREESAVWLMPLRVLVEEKALWLTRLLQTRYGDRFHVEARLGRRAAEEGSLHPEPDVTGDRLLLPDPQVLLTTYEWFFHHHAGGRPMGVVVVDEAQELYTPERGEILHRIIISLIMRERPPRVTMLGHAYSRDLSQIMGNIEVIRSLDPPNIALRFMPGETSVDAITRQLQALFSQDPRAVVAIFVAQVSHTERLAENLKERIPEITAAMGPEFKDNMAIEAFHAGLEGSRRRSLLETVHKGVPGVTVTTTALAKGVDLPFTAVIVRDTRLPGRPPLTLPELLQLGARCGRRGRRGEVIVLRPKPTKEGYPPLPVERVLRNALLGALCYEKRSLGLLMEEVGSMVCRGGAQGVVNALTMLSRCGAVTIKSDLCEVTPVGRALFSAPVPLSFSMAWASFFRETGTLPITPFDLILVYAALSCDVMSPRGVSPSAPSVLWDRWLGEGRWEPLFVTLGLTRDPRRGGRPFPEPSRVLGEAERLWAQRSRGHTPRGFDTLLALREIFLKSHGQL